MKKTLTILFIALCGIATSAPVRSMMAARNSTHNIEMDVLPYDAEVEWIQPSSDTAYISSGYTPPQGYQLDLDVEWIARSGTRKVVFGQSWDIQCYGLINANSTIIQIGWSDSYVNVTNPVWVTGHHYRIVKDGLTTTFADITAGIEKSYQTRTWWRYYRNIPFCFIGIPLTSYSGRDQIIKCKVYDPNINVMLFDVIPVRFTNEDGNSEGALYDRVSKKLFRNSGTGSFIIGPDK